MKKMSSHEIPKFTLRQMRLILIGVVELWDTLMSPLAGFSERSQQPPQCAPVANHGLLWLVALAVFPLALGCDTDGAAGYPPWLSYRETVLKFIGKLKDA